MERLRVLASLPLAGPGQRKRHGIGVAIPRFTSHLFSHFLTTTSIHIKTSLLNGVPRRLREQFRGDEPRNGAGPHAEAHDEEQHCRD